MAPLESSGLAICNVKEQTKPSHYNDPAWSLFCQVKCRVEFLINPLQIKKGIFFSVFLPAELFIFFFSEFVVEVHFAFIFFHLQ